LDFWRSEHALVSEEGDVLRVVGGTPDALYGGGEGKGKKRRKTSGASATSSSPPPSPLEARTVPGEGGRLGE
jgi:hypothetical protein